MTDLTSPAEIAPGELLSNSHFQALLDASTPIEFQADALIVKQGERSDVAYFLGEGAVRIEAETPFGPVLLATVTAPRVIGEIGALAGLPRTASIRAAGPVRMHRLERARLQAFGRSEPQFLLSIIAQLGHEIEAVNRAIGFYTNALSALERREFDVGLLDELRSPPPELAAFASVFQRFALEIQSKRRREDELASAAIIQQSFLPKPDVLVRNGTRPLDLHAAIRPAREVGGDFYDYFWLDETRLAFAVGDICGKGLPASLFAAAVITVLRSTAREASAVGAALERANAHLSHDNAAGLFATAFFGIIDTTTGDLSYGNCGHNAPMIVDAQGRVTLLPAMGLPLALYDDRSAAVRSVRLERGSTLLVYTDGITEAMNAKSEEFGETRLTTLVPALTASAASSAEIAAALFEAVDTFAAGAEQADDMTCIVTKY